MVSLCGPARRRPRPAGGVPRRRRRHADGHADGVHRRGSDRAAARGRRAGRGLTTARRSAGLRRPAPADLPRGVRRSRARVPDARARVAARRARARGDARDLGRGGASTSRRRGCGSCAAPEYPVFPTRERPLAPVRGGRAGDRRRPAGRWPSRAPDVVVHDILTLAPALAGELEGVPGRDADPARLSRRRAGLSAVRARRAAAANARSAGALWRLLRPAGRGRAAPGARRAERGAGEARACRRSTRLHGGLSERLCIVGTFPQLEYPRRWPAHVHVVGPLLWEPPFRRGRAAAGERRRWSSSRPRPRRIPQHRLLRAALAGLARRAGAGAGHVEPPAAPPAPVRGAGRTPGWSSGSPTRGRCPAARW